MNRSCMFSSVFLLLVLLSGCATTHDLPTEKRTRVYRVPYLRLFRAAVDYCHENGFTLYAADPALGVITTDYRSEDTLSARMFGNMRPKIELTIRELRKDSLTLVAAALSFMENKGSVFSDKKNEVPIQRYTVEEYYQKVFGGIESNLGKGQGR